jgi:hypothetical protein
MTTSAAVPLLGFDQNGQVFDAGDVVLRQINDGYKERVNDLYRLYRAKELASKGIVETTLRADGGLEHRKLVISYPYEWTANMYKDAVLFHLRLLSDLGKAGLTLKDALPNNILFDHTRPVFVDFLSLVLPEHLGDEGWLDAKRYADPRFGILDTMFFPFMLHPLLFFCRGKNALARQALSTGSCNCDGEPPAWRELLRPFPRDVIGLRRYLTFFSMAARAAPLHFRNSRKPAREFDAFVDKLLAFVGGVDATPPRSAYSFYYDEKKEAFSPGDRESFLPKQRTVLDVLTDRKPASVLDIGANTGWYSSLAERLGASVIALEEDESCVDLLYNSAKTHGRRILALKASFADLPREIHASAQLHEEYEDRGVKTTPLYRPGVQRLGADMVLMLGLFHHLVLGEGRSISEIFQVLDRLARRTLILEFVALDDEKILGDPGFFKSLRKFDTATYSLELVVQAGRRHFARAEVLASHPSTRTILAFDR